MKKFVMAFAAAASLVISTPVLAQSANDSMRWQEARDPGYRAAVLSRYTTYGYGYAPYGYSAVGMVPQATTCFSVFIASYCSSHQPNPVKDNTAKVGGAEYKACPVNNDPAVPINTPCLAASAGPVVTCTGSCSYQDGDFLVTIVTAADGSQTITKKRIQR